MVTPLGGTGNAYEISTNVGQSEESRRQVVGMRASGGAVSFHYQVDELVYVSLSEELMGASYTGYISDQEHYTTLQNTALHYDTWHCTMLHFTKMNTTLHQGIYGDQKRYEENYFGPFPGYFFTGDGCRRDADGYYWITGRVDDVINVSGHRIGTAEVEGALGQHPSLAECAVVGFDHALKGQGIYAFVTLKEHVEYDVMLKKELKQTVRESIGAFAVPDFIHWAPSGLPKTRSGKIMRRILRKVASSDDDQLGDISTLADPLVVRDLIDIRGSIFE
eukprot:gene26531-18361_t